MTEKIRQTNKLIKLEQNKLQLLKELRQSLKEENAKIIVHNTVNERFLFIAIDRLSKEQICSGDFKYVRDYLLKREYTEIYWRPLKK